MPPKPPFGNSLNAIALFFCINLYLILIFGSETFNLSIFGDDGAISILTICFVLAAQLFVLYEMATAAKLTHKIDWFILAYILQIYVMREADFHHTFTSTNVTKTSFYLNASNPLYTKLIAGSILMLCFLAVLYLASKYVVFCLKLLNYRTPWTISALFWFSLLILSQLFDKSALNDTQDLRVQNIEEMLEFSAAIYLFLAAILYNLGKTDSGGLVSNE